MQQPAHLLRMQEQIFSAKAWPKESTLDRQSRLLGSRCWSEPAAGPSSKHIAEVCAERVCLYLRKMAGKVKELGCPLFLCGVLRCVARSTHVCSFEYIIFSPHTKFIHHNLLLKCVPRGAKDASSFFVPPLVGDLFAEVECQVSFGSLRALAADAINAGRIFEYLAADNGPQMRRVTTNCAAAIKYYMFLPLTACVHHQ